MNVDAYTVDGQLAFENASLEAVVGPENVKGLEPALRARGWAWVGGRATRLLKLMTVRPVALTAAEIGGLRSILADLDGMQPERYGLTQEEWRGLCAKFSAPRSKENTSCG